MRGTECVLQEFPLCIELLLIVTRMGRDYRPGPRQRREQVARQGSQPYPQSFQLDKIATVLDGHHMFRSCIIMMHSAGNCSSVSYWGPV